MHTLRQIGKATKEVAAPAPSHEVLPAFTPMRTSCCITMWGRAAAFFHVDTLFIFIYIDFIYLYIYIAFQRLLR